MLTHASHSDAITQSFSGWWSINGPFEIYTGHGEEVNNSNTRAGLSGSFGTGGGTYSFSGSWPYCA